MKSDRVCTGDVPGYIIRLGVEVTNGYVHRTLSSSSDIGARKNHGEIFLVHW